MANLNQPITVDVLSHQELSGYVMRVLVSQPAEPFRYISGQYVQMAVDNLPPRPFSIANAFDDKVIEFHIRHVPDNSFSQALISQIKQTQKISFTGPCGEMRYQKYPRYPLLLIAAGTGFAPCKAIIEEALRDPDHTKIYLYWTVRKQADLYWHEELVKLTQKFPQFKYTPVISTEERVDKVVLREHPELRDVHVYIGGPEEMVKDLQEKFFYPPYFYSDWV